MTPQELLDKILKMDDGSDIRTDNLFSDIYEFVWDQNNNPIINLVENKETRFHKAKDVDELLGLIIENVRNMTIETMIACVRLPYIMKNFLPNWKPAVLAMKEELIKRNEDANSILCGLLD